MFSKEMKDVVERGLFGSQEAFRALRAVGFMLKQIRGSGPFDWTAQSIEDLGSLVELIADHGNQVSTEALDQVSVGDSAPVRLNA